MAAANGAAALPLSEVCRILRGLLLNAGAALYDAQRELVWTDGVWMAEEAVATHRMLAGEQVANHAVQLPSGRSLHVSPVPAVAPDGDESFFAVVCESGAEEGVSDAIAALAAGMAREERLNAELDGMASELADRYEELNLVYATTNQRPRVGTGPAVLKDIVKNCHDHLDVGLVALMLPAQRLSFEQHDSRSPVQHLSAFLRAIEGQFFEDFARVGRTLVLNDGLDGYAAELQSFGAMKLAATPVHDGRGAVCGLLIMVNPTSAADFSNSDKNLLSSIAEKAAKIVQANYDALTGLFLKEEFERRLHSAHRRSREVGDEHCVLFIDLDQLDVVNETLGHQAGDEMLRCVGRHLDGCQASDRVAARLGGTEFGLLLESCRIDDAREVAEALRSSLGELQFVFDNHPIEIAACIGVAGMDHNTENAATILDTARLASKAAREKGRGSVQVYQNISTSVIEHADHMRWVGRIQEALRENRFRLYAQAIRPLHGCDEPHVEILLRLQDSQGQTHSPGAFLPAAERYFLMPSIDRWVISQALTTLAHSAEGADLPCSINLSGQSMNDDTFIAFILNELDRSGINAANICFEITETAAITNLATAKQFMLRLREKGCRFSLDDFGTGLSSFSYLKALPVDFVKIDGSFVKDVVEDPVAEAIVISITQVGHAMGLRIIAEYVENAAIENRLREIGVDYAQGYAIGRPIPLREHFTARRNARMAAAG